MKKKDVQTFRKWYDDLLARAGSIAGQNGYQDRVYTVAGWLDLTLQEPESCSRMLWIAGCFADHKAMRAWFGESLPDRANRYSSKWNFQSWPCDITPVRAFYEFYSELFPLVPPHRHPFMKDCSFFTDTKGLEDIWPPSPSGSFQHLALAQ